MVASVTRPAMSMSRLPDVFLRTTKAEPLIGVHPDLQFLISNSLNILETRIPIQSLIGWGFFFLIDCGYLKMDLVNVIIQNTFLVKAQRVELGGF